MPTARWPSIEDEALVERLIPAIQRTIADTCAPAGGRTPDEWIAVGGPDLANVLLMLLATIVEPLPACSTPQGIRLFSEAAGKELAALIRDTRRLVSSANQDPGSMQ